jgi:hypothetical protein
MDLISSSSSDDGGHGAGHVSDHSDAASQQPNLAHKNNKPLLLLNGYDFMPVKSYLGKLKPIVTANVCELKAIFLVVCGAPAAAIVSQFRVTMQPSITSDHITEQLESSKMRLTVVSAHSNNEGSFALGVGQIVDPPSSRAGFFFPDDHHRGPQGEVPARWIFNVEALDDEAVVWECSHEVLLKISRKSPLPNAQAFDVSKFAKLELSDDQRPVNRPAKMPKTTSESSIASPGSNSFASETNNHPKDEEQTTAVVMQECGSFEIVDAAQQAKAESNKRAALIVELQNGKLECECKLEEWQRRCDVLSDAKIKLIDRNHDKHLVNEDLREQLSTLQQSHDGLLLEKKELEATISQHAEDDLLKSELHRSVTCHYESQLEKSNQGSTSERKSGHHEAQLAKPDRYSAGDWEGVMIDLTNSSSFQRDQLIERGSLVNYLKRLFEEGKYSICADELIAILGFQYNITCVACNSGRPDMTVDEVALLVEPLLKLQPREGHDVGSFVRGCDDVDTSHSNGAETASFTRDYSSKVDGSISTVPKGVLLPVDRTEGVRLDKANWCDLTKEEQLNLTWLCVYARAKTMLIHHSPQLAELPADVLDLLVVSVGRTSISSFHRHIGTDNGPCNNLSMLENKGVITKEEKSTLTRGCRKHMAAWFTGFTQHQQRCYWGDCCLDPSSPVPTRRSNDPTLKKQFLGKITAQFSKQLKSK